MNGRFYRQFFASENANRIRMLAVLEWMYANDEKWPDDKRFAAITKDLTSRSKPSETKQFAVGQGVLLETDLPTKAGLDLVRKYHAWRIKTNFD